MIIYIRHGDDEDDDATHRHDHHINKKGKKRARKVAKRLIKKYGNPNVIYCSPFRRTLETLYYMKEKIQNNPKIYIDPDLSRYFSTTEQLDPSVFPETMDKDIPIYENRNKFHKRVKNHIRRMEKHKYHKNEKVVWCITHTLIMKDVGRYWSIDLPDHFDFFQKFIIAK